MARTKTKQTSKVSTKLLDAQGTTLKAVPAGLNEPTVVDPKLTALKDITIKPVNWFILVRERAAARMTDGGLHLADQSIHAEQVLTYFGEVMAMGENCYKHPKFCGAEPQCKVGDWVIIGRYAGQKMKLKRTGEIFRMITDDMVMGVTTEPDDLLVYA